MEGHKSYFGTPAEEARQKIHANCGGKAIAEEMRSVSIEIFGKVQGVWFRASAQRKARELGITGFVKNNRDGSVYVEAHGEDDAIKDLIAWCKSGPPHARVDQVMVEDVQYFHGHSFDIKR